MIASLRGVVLSNNSGSVVLEVGGVGYAVSTVANERARHVIGQELFLHTAFIVREDAQLLFGFETAEELAVFDLLRSVTGVGPKSAQAVLAVMTLSEIAGAVVAENDAAFKKVVGIGPKTAKLIIVSLAGKIGKAGFPEATSEAAGKSAESSREMAQASAAVIEALLGLGYQERIVAPVVNQIADELKTANRNELLRAALARLGPSKTTLGGE